MQTFTNYILISEFEKSHTQKLFTREWDGKNEIIKEILEGFKSMEGSVVRMMK